MEMLLPPITKIEKDKFQLKVDLNCYDKDAVVAATYKFTDKFFIYQQTDPENQTSLYVLFEAKDRASVDEADVKNFCNELIDQQIRIDVNEKFGKIRDMIVEEAFKPITK